MLRLCDCSICGKVLVQIGKKIAFHADISGGEGDTCGGNGVNARRVIDEIGVKARFFDLLHGKIARELI